MKKMLLIFALVLGTIAADAQRDETLFNRSNRFGAFGGPIVEYSSLDGNIKTAVGGGGGLILGDMFIGGYGLGSTDFGDLIINGNEFDRLDLAHGGLWLGYVTPQDKVVHGFSSVKVGWGALDLDFNNSFRAADDIFVVTPEVGLEVNVFRWFRISASAGYRWVSDVDDRSLGNNAFNSFTGQLNFRFGSFGRYRYNDDRW